MIEIEFEEPVDETCDCCGGKNTRLTRFVYKNGDAFAVYYGMYSDNHPESEVKLAISLGESGEGSTPEDRRSFGLILREAEDVYQVSVIDAEELPWREAKVIGRTLNRDEALKHPWIKDVFHITDQIVEDDSVIKEYFAGRGNAA
jgi:hypothetical protein